ncbi:hypothetical protein [Streptomyces sp. AF1A]|uniref:hypothetical protein n=1 Tax=Streptomyces sp. AF1A TaxID=3394350 RepID=UPI0039BD7A73
MSGASWQARVECGGVVHGAGVLVSPTTVLTCEDEDGYGHPHDTVGDEAPPRAYRTRATFEFADGARHPDTVAALGRAVTRLLTASGPARHTLRPTARDNGWTVVTAPGMAGLPLLHATMRHFEDEVVQLGTFAGW